ncbi:MAG: hypothetical protein NZ959_08750, partial [Armatimonadetes bacterium]|nr:hypothetical protein [Armatimonadota bacterium]MDW8122559.1 hypothetical protein [Armatimonadota bacterium]
MIRRTALFLVVGFLIVLWLLHRSWGPADVMASYQKALSPDRTIKDRIQAVSNLYRFLTEGTVPAEQKKKAVTLLMRVAHEDDSEEVRTRALSHLVQLPLEEDEKVNLLLTALSRSSQEADIAIQAFESITSLSAWRGVLDYYDEVKDPVVADRLLRLLRNLPDSVLPDFCRRLGQDQRRWAPVADQLKGPSVNELTRLALDRDKNVCVGALLLLSRFLPERENALRLVPLLKSPQKEVRALAATVLSKAPFPDLVPKLKERLKDEPAVAEPVSSALVQMGALSAEEGRELVRRPTAPLRAAGVLALARSDREDDFRLLTGLLYDPDLVVARNAAAALAAKGQRGLETVLRAWRGELTESRRAAWLEGIAGVNNPMVLDALMTALRYGGWQEQAVAVSGLAFHGDEAVKQLRR